MPRNATTGAYSAPTNSFNPAVADTVISETDWASLLGDMSTALAHAAAGTRALYPTLGQVQDAAMAWGGVAGGTADALTVALSPAIPAYVAGQMVGFITAGAANTGAVTLAVNGLAATALRRADGTTALQAGELPAGSLVRALYDGTVFRLMAVAAPGPWWWLGTQTASGSAQIDFALPAGISRFRLTMDGVVPATDGASLILRVSQNGGGSYLAGASDYANGGSILGQGAGAGAFSSVGTSVGLTGAMTNGTADTTEGEVTFTPGTTSVKATFRGSVGAIVNGTGERRLTMVYATVSATTARCTNIRLSMTSGNIATGRFILFGGL